MGTRRTRVTGRGHGDGTDTTRQASRQPRRHHQPHQGQERGATRDKQAQGHGNRGEKAGRGTDSTPQPPNAPPTVSMRRSERDENRTDRRDDKRGEMRRAAGKQGTPQHTPARRDENAIAPQPNRRSKQTEGHRPQKTRHEQPVIDIDRTQGKTKQAGTPTLPVQRPAHRVEHRGDDQARRQAMR